MELNSGRWKIDADRFNACSNIFVDLSLSYKTRSLVRFRWTTNPQDLDSYTLPGEVIFRQRSVHKKSEERLLGIKTKSGAGYDALAQVEYENQQVWVTISAQTDKQADEILAQLRAAIPEGQPLDPKTVRVTFWTHAAEGARGVTKDLSVPAWEEVRPNYAQQTIVNLEDMFAPKWRPASGGRLILWHGDPGTGKTYGLRSLMSAWKKWCTFHVVLDPERFFGAGDYMISVLLGGEHDDYDEDDVRNTKWRLLIMEDTGELLTADAKDRAGQGLSRLLNLCDGLLGQGLQVLTLITTNEDLGRMHQAVTRPGRCLSNVEFLRMSGVEAESWMTTHGIEPKVAKKEARTCTLADLYARIETGRPLGGRGDHVGF